MEIFARRKDNKKKEGKSRRRLIVWVVAAALFSSTTALFLSWNHWSRLTTHVRDSFLSHSYFAVREIKVRGGGQEVGGSEIVAVAGLSQGMNIWKIDPGIIEKKVGKHPWVKRVLVRREFPHRVVIEVEERVAKGIVVLGKLYYVDPEGFVFKEIEEGERVDLPLLTGLQREDLLSQPQSVRQKVQEALRLIDLLRKESFDLSEIHFSARGDVILYPMTHRFALHMGWGDWSGKVERLDRVLAVWRGEEGRLAALDLSFRDQVVARLRKG